jgi:hypothetical protein
MKVLGGVVRDCPEALIHHGRYHKFGAAQYAVCLRALCVKIKTNIEPEQPSTALLSVVVNWTGPTYAAAEVQVKFEI